MRLTKRRSALADERRCRCHRLAASHLSKSVNQTFVRGMFGSSAKIGLRFMMGDKNSYEIVGIAEDGKYDSLTDGTVVGNVFSRRANPDRDTSLILRLAMPTGDLIPQLSRVLAQIDEFAIHVPELAECAGLRIVAGACGDSQRVRMGLPAAMLAITGNLEWQCTQFRSA